MKAFLQSPARKFAVLIHASEDTGARGRLLAEGLLGLFLSAAQEYPGSSSARWKSTRTPISPWPCARAGQGLRCRGAHAARRQALHPQAHLAPAVFAIRQV